MQSREFELRVRDMLTEIAVVVETITGLTIEAFSQHRQAWRAVLYSLAVIGEAVASAIAEFDRSGDPMAPDSRNAKCRHS
ncbi:hypothetical protein [Leptolyngbya sp. CCY15150]|uniref:hypothetical protein n=1 Tax=Leptolyngbya sp. CCY15150 TaxID=2767772 RepID=UPI001EF25D29|nr:hypothetical protein [Leptolyngbya sp. CCY15150]